MAKRTESSVVDGIEGMLGAKACFEHSAVVEDQALGKFLIARVEPFLSGCSTAISSFVRSGSHFVVSCVCNSSTSTFDYPRCCSIQQLSSSWDSKS